MDFPRLDRTVVMKRLNIALVSRQAVVAVASLVILAISAASSAAEVDWKPLVLPRALVIVGPWGDEFRWREALHEQGIAYDEAYRAQNIYHNPFIRLNGMPPKPEDFRNYSLVMIINVELDLFSQAQLDSLRQFVSAGGGLVVLGGYWAFNRGNYYGTSFAEMLPVEVPKHHDVVAHRAGARLAFPASATWGSKLKLEPAPCAFFIQEMPAKPQTVVELLAGGQPALVRGSFGAGRAVTCGLTIHGKSTPDALGFWDWPEWPKLLGQAVDWAGGARPLDPGKPVTPGLVPLTDDEIRQVQTRFQPANEAFLARFAATPTKSAAAVVFERLFVGEKDKGDGALTPDVVAALVPHVQPSWYEPLAKQADELNPDIAVRRAALELLGATRSPQVAKVLIESLANGDVAMSAVDGLRWLDDPAHIKPLLRVYDATGAVTKLVEDDEVAVETTASSRQRHLLIHTAVALYRLGDPGGVERIVKLHRTLRLQQRIYANAGKRRVSDTDATGIAIVRMIHTKRADLAVLEAYILAAAGPIPASQQAAFLQFARTTRDDSDVRWIMSALAREPAGSQWSPLAEAQDGIVRRLGHSLVKASR